MAYFFNLTLVFCNPFVQISVWSGKMMGRS
jgi:hypothetical protein